MWLITIVDNDSVVDFEALAKTGLLDGLDAGNRAERAELIAWLLEQGFGVEQIRRESAPTLLPVRRALGDDGSHVSAREMSETPLLNRDSSKALQVKPYYSVCTGRPKTAPNRRRFGSRLQHIQLSQADRGCHVALVEGGSLLCCQRN
jgi:Adenylate cyclase regulatory domain